MTSLLLILWMLAYLQKQIEILLKVSKWLELRLALTYLQLKVTSALHNLM
jgi:hypothetical protein